MSLGGNRPSREEKPRKSNEAASNRQSTPSGERFSASKSRLLLADAHNSDVSPLSSSPSSSSASTVCTLPHRGTSLLGNGESDCDVVAVAWGRMNRNGVDRARMTGSQSPNNDSLSWLAAHTVTTTTTTTSAGVAQSYPGLYRQPGRLYGGDHLYTSVTTTVAAAYHPSVYTGARYGAYLYPSHSYPPPPLHPESFSAVLHSLGTHHAQQVPQFATPHAPHAPHISPHGYKEPAPAAASSPDGYRYPLLETRKHRIAPTAPQRTDRHHSEPQPKRLKSTTSTMSVANPPSEPPTLPPPPPLRPASRPHYPPHFTRGSVIQLANGQLKRVEELRTDDFVGSASVSDDLQIDSSTVTRIEPQQDSGTALLGFSVGENHVQVTVEATLEHPFFVFHRGWSSCQPARTLERYGLHCHQLLIGDVCISLTQKTPGRATELPARIAEARVESSSPSTSAAAAAQPTSKSRWFAAKSSSSTAMPPPLPPATTVAVTTTAGASASPEERSAMKDIDQPKAPPT